MKTYILYVSEDDGTLFQPSDIDGADDGNAFVEGYYRIRVNDPVTLNMNDVCGCHNDVSSLLVESRQATLIDTFW